MRWVRAEGRTAAGQRSERRENAAGRWSRAPGKPRLKTSDSRRALGQAAWFCRSQRGWGGERSAMGSRDERGAPGQVLLGRVLPVQRAEQPPQAGQRPPLNEQG